MKNLFRYLFAIFATLLILAAFAAKDFKAPKNPEDVFLTQDQQIQIIKKKFPNQTITIITNNSRFGNTGEYEVWTDSGKYEGTFTGEKLKLEKEK